MWGKEKSGKNIFRKARCSISVFMIAVCFLGISGCAMREKDEGKEKQTEVVKENKAIRDHIISDSQKLAEEYQVLYEKAEREEQLSTLEFQQQVISYMGDVGYSAVDLNNQIDMTNAKQVETFCQVAEAGKEDEVTILAVTDHGGFVRYDLTAENGKIYARESALNWKENKPIVDYYHEFEVYDWKYTEKGYLFMEEYHPPGYDGATGDIGFRVKSLDFECRELNRRCVLPIGYELNNLLITNWDSSDYTNLELYDLYEQMYSMKYGEIVPYRWEEGIEYQIPEHSFEEVLQTFLPISSMQIRNQTVYEEQNRTYRYRPRGLYDCELPFVPYPEVVSYEKLENGEWKLIVEAVWIKEKTDCAIASELVVKPLEDGKIQYLSNHVIELEEEEGKEEEKNEADEKEEGIMTGDTEREKETAPWYTSRLTDEEWERYYGGKVDE